MHGPLDTALIDWHCVKKGNYLGATCLVLKNFVKKQEAAVPVRFQKNETLTKTRKRKLHENVES